VSVRVAAITGVCRVLSYYWELIPASVIKSFLTKLVVELCRDTSSDIVRVTVLQVSHAHHNSFALFLMIFLSGYVCHHG